MILKIIIKQIWDKSWVSTKTVIGLSMEVQAKDSIQVIHSIIIEHYDDQQKLHMQGKYLVMSKYNQQG